MAPLKIFAAVFVIASAQSPGSYDQYMKQYAGDFSKYTSQGGSSNSAGDYSNYMKQYAGSYSNHMGQGGSAGSAGGFDKYMKQYAGSYMNQGGSSNSAAGYDQYMKQYAGSYSKYMSQGSNGNSAGSYDKYMKQYAGSSTGNYNKYSKQYAGDYSKYMSQASAGGAPTATLLLQQDSKSKDVAQEGSASKVVSLESLHKKAERLEKKLQDDKSREAARVADNTERAAARVADDKARQELHRAQEDQKRADADAQQEHAKFDKRAQRMEQRIEGITGQIHGKSHKNAKVATTAAPESSFPLAAAAKQGAANQQTSGQQSDSGAGGLDWPFEMVEKDGNSKGDNTEKVTAVNEALAALSTGQENQLSEEKKPSGVPMFIAVAGMVMLSGLVMRIVFLPRSAEDEVAFQVSINGERKEVVLSKSLLATESEDSAYSSRYDPPTLV